MVWSNTNTKGRGLELFEYLTKTDLDVSNTDKTPNSCNAIKDDVLDLTLSSVSLVERLRNWCVCSEPTNWEGFKSHSQDALSAFHKEIVVVSALNSASGNLTRY